VSWLLPILTIYACFAINNPATQLSRKVLQGAQGGGSARDRSREGVSPGKGDDVNTQARSILRIFLSTLIEVLGALAAAAQPLFSDDFGPKPLGGWTASPLGLFANWDASSGAAADNDGGQQLYAGTLASLTVGGNPVTFATETIKGLTYAVFSASSGSYVATYAP
jgi:hypothetical protein